MPRAKSRVDVILSLKNNMAGGLARASMNLNRLGDAAKRFGMIGAAATGAMVVGLAKVINETKKLDDALRNLAAKLGTDFDGKVFAGLEKEIRRLGRTTSFTTTQVAELATVLAQGGKSADQIRTMTASMLHLSRAMSEGTADSARIAQSAMDAYGLSVDDARRAADVLSYTVNNSNQNLIDLGEANNYVAATSRDAGISIERTSAMLAVMANNGIRGSRAGVQLRAALLQLTTKGKETADALDIKLTEPTGEFRDFGIVLDEFRAKTENMTDVRRFELYKKAFGKVGISAATILGRSRKEVDLFTRKLEQSFGTAEKASKDMDAGIGGSFRMLYSAAEALWLAVGDKLTPAVEKFTRKITEMLKALGDEDSVTAIADGIIKMLKTLIKATGALLALGAAASSVAALFSSLLFTMAATKMVVSSASSAIASLSTSTIVLGKVFAHTLKKQHGDFFAVITKGAHSASGGVGRLAGKTAQLAKAQLTFTQTGKVANAVRKRAAAQQARTAKKAFAAEVASVKAINKARRKVNLRTATRAANDRFATEGVKLSARQVAGMPTGTNTSAPKPNLSDLGKGGKVPVRIYEDPLTAGMSKGSTGIGGTIQRTSPNAGRAAQAALKNKSAASTKNAMAFAREQFKNLNSMTMKAMPQGGNLASQGAGVGTKLATGIKTGLTSGLKNAPKLIFTGLKVGVKAVFTSVASIGLTLAEALIVGFTGSEAQAAYGLAGDFMSGALFTGIFNGMKEGGAEIARGLLLAFEFASEGDWKAAWESIKLSIELGFRELMDNMSGGVKTFVDALNNFQSGSFVTFLRKVYRGFSFVANALGQVVDGIAYLVSFGNLENLTGSVGIGEHLDQMKAYDDKLEMNSGNTFFNNNSARLKQLEEEKRAQEKTLSGLKEENAIKERMKQSKKQQMSMEERWNAQERKKQLKGEEKARNIKKAAFRKAQADAAQAVLEERQAKQAALIEDLKALGIKAKVEADEEGKKESAKYSKMSEVTRKITRAGIGGLGGEGVMRQFAEKQNSVHKQNLDSQHRQESELRQINVQLKKYALESLLLKP